MPYIFIQDFKGGLDRRRMREVAPAGTLWTLENAHLTRGAEIEKAKAWVERFELPAGTFGFGFIPGGEPTVFGSAAEPGGMPAGVDYQHLQHPDGLAMTEVLCVSEYEGAFYVVARFDDDTVHHFYDGEWIADWWNGVVRSGMLSNDSIAEHLRALVDAHEDFSATRAGSVITITGPDDTAFTVTCTATNGEGNSNDDQSLLTSVIQAASSGIPQQSIVTVGGTPEVGDEFTISITMGSDTHNFGRLNNPQPVAEYAFPYKSKMYALADNVLFASGINTATGWNTSNTGAGFVILSRQSAGAEEAMAASEYFQKVAILFQSVIQLWALDADFDANNYDKPLKNTGTIARKSVVAFGDNDVFYLSTAGIRSIRARDSSNEAFVSDVGTSIDDLVKEILAGLTADERAAAAAAIDPTEGRYILSLGDRMLVFTYFPNSKIAAWSTYEAGFAVDFWDNVDGVLHARSGDSIYALGGADGDEYDEDMEVVVELPFVDADDPATPKQWFALDAALEGEWDIYIGFDETNPDAYTKAATVSATTFGKQRIPVDGFSAKAFLRLEHSGAGRARVGQLVLHHMKASEEGAA